MWRVLAVLSSDGGQRQIDVAAKTSIDVSTLSRVVTRLTEMGLVTAYPLRHQQPRGRGSAHRQGAVNRRSPDPECDRRRAWRDRRRAGQGPCRGAALAAPDVREPGRARGASAGRAVGRASSYCSVTPAILTASPQSAISLPMNAANSAGFGSAGSTPFLCNCSTKLASFMARASSAAMRSTIGFAVPAGAARPVHDTAWKPG